MSNSCYLSQSHAYYIMSFLSQHMLKMSSYSTNASNGLCCHLPTFIQ